MIDFTKSVSGRFIRYTQFDTMSDPSLAGKCRPTTEGQSVLQKALVRDLEELGLDVTYGDTSVVHGILRANEKGALPVAFMAHVDTADDVMGNNVKAVRHSYQGGDIVLKGTVIRQSDNPDLEQCIGSENFCRRGRQKCVWSCAKQAACAQRRTGRVGICTRCGTQRRSSRESQAGYREHAGGRHHP